MRAVRRGITESRGRIGSVDKGGGGAEEEEAKLMGIRRQFRVRNLSSWNVTGILANLFFLRPTPRAREGVKLDGLQNEFLS